jgi:hypothetical protein
VERYKEIKAVRSKYGNDSYSAATGTALALSRALINSLDPDRAKRFNHIDYHSATWQEDYYRDIQTFLSGSSQR